MPSLSKRGQNLALLGFLLFGQMLLMAMSARDAAGTSKLETVLVKVSSPFVRLSGAIGGALGGGWSGFHELVDAKRENRTLKTRVDRLEWELQTASEKASELDRLRDLLELHDLFEGDALAARIVHASLSEHARVLYIDRGFADGVQNDMPVLAYGGAVGKVLMAEKHVSKVRLIHDPDHRVAARLQRTRARGMLYGVGDGPLRLRYVPVFNEVLPGDRVVTSGLDGIFPPGVTLGWISLVGEDSQVDKTLEVRGAVDVTRLEEVLVLLRPPTAEVLRRLDPPLDGDGP